MSLKKVKKLPFKNNKNSRIGYKKHRGLKSMLKKVIESEPLFLSMMNRIGVEKGQKLCDVTNLPTKYTCPRTGLNYYNREIFEYIRDLKPDFANRYLYLRNFGKRNDMFLKY